MHINPSYIIIRTSLSIYFKNTNEYSDEDLQKALIYFNSLNKDLSDYDDLSFCSISLLPHSFYQTALVFSTFMDMVLNSIANNIEYYSYE